MKKLSYAQFREQLPPRHDRRPVLLDVHGLKTTFLKSLRRGYKLRQAFDKEVVVFSWPSGASASNYNLAINNLGKSVDGLTSLLITLQPRVCTAF